MEKIKKIKNVKPFYKNQKCTKKKQNVEKCKKKKSSKRDQSQNKNPSYDNK